MFTGIIKNSGKLKKIEKKNDKVIFKISSDLKNLELRQSISIDGVCLTIITINKNSFEEIWWGEIRQKHLKLMRRNWDISS